MGQSDQPVPSARPPHEPTSTVELPAPPPAPTLPTGPPPFPPRRSGRKFLTIGAAFLLLAGAIAGVVLAAGGTKSSPGPASSPTPGAPVGLTATAAVAPFAVTLSWSPPAGEPTILGYKVFRDQLQIAAVPAGSTTYTDQNVFPGELFTYAVVTRGNGVLESQRTSVQVEVPIPPVSAARVSGTFNVKAKTVSQQGFQDDLGSFTVGWNFAPKCDEGACSVVWKDVTEKTLKATLKRKGARYSGSDSGKFLGRCGSVLTNGTVTIFFRVTKAKAIGNEWRASKLVGTITNSIPSQLGCVSADVTLSITATVLS